MKLCCINVTLTKESCGLSFCALDTYFRLGHLSVWVIRPILSGRTPNFRTPSWEIDPTVGIRTLRGNLYPTWEIEGLTPPWEIGSVIRVDPSVGIKERVR